MKLFHLLAGVFLVPLLAACGGGGSGASDSGAGAPAADTSIQTGRLVDSAVAGLSYRTATMSGITNANGEFTYRPGEKVVFGLGDLEFPAVTAAQILTPLELAGVNDISNVSVLNMARLLQSLDKDCDPKNGITVGGEALLAAAGLSLKFDDPDFDNKVRALVTNGGQQDATCRVLISADAAVAHLWTSLVALGRQPTPPIGGGLAGKLGVWEGTGQQTGVSWTIRITLQAASQQIEYPSLSCGGVLTLVNESPAQLLFRETITVGKDRCLDQGLIELTDRSASGLVYRYFFADTAGARGELGAVGSLTRR